MNGRLVLQTVRWQAVRLAAVVVAGVAWGALMPFVYTQFSDLIREMANSGQIPQELLNFGSGSLTSVSGTITLGLQHPIAIALVAIFAVGAASTAVAGERARGTLEVLLARPISRTRLYWSLLVGIGIATFVAFGAVLGGAIGGTIAFGLADQVELGRLPWVILNGFGLWAAFLTFSLAASITFDRPGPAIGISLAWLLIHYFLEILGSLWTDAAWTQQYSLLHHFNPGAILSGNGDPMDLVIVLVATVVPISYALYLFPQRDLAAPS
ncbi:MAG: ABC transporter permease subunit [Chloroflexi bacterium]|nr:ABC transporter permease subunit [Chloroflexota bacterium]